MVGRLVGGEVDSGCRGGRYLRAEISEVRVGRWGGGL